MANKKPTNSTAKIKISGPYKPKTSDAKKGK